MKVTQNDYAWAAGIFDGEGCINISKQKPCNGMKNPSYVLRIQIAMCHKKTVYKLLEIFPEGKVYAIERRKHHPNYKDQWRFAIQSHNCKNFLTKILPYSVTKLDQLNLGLEYLQLPKGNVGGKPMPTELVEKRELYYQQMKDLKE